MGEPILENKGRHPTGPRRMTDTTVVEIECVNTAKNTVIARCWEPTPRMARVEWYEFKRTIVIPHQELFHRTEATRVNARGQRSYSLRCHFENYRTLPRPLLETSEKTPLPKWLQKAVDLCKSQPRDYIARIYTDEF